MPGMTMKQAMPAGWLIWRISLFRPAGDADRQARFLTVSASYWAFTLTDGALRMLVLLHFYQAGLNAFQLALLFTLYELAGIFTNLAGGWLAGRFGLRAMLSSGIGLQIGALVMLAGLNSSWPGWLALVWVLLSQGLSGIAKDMTKVAAKSAIRLSAGQAGRRLCSWTAFFTGSKNSVKGAGFSLAGCCSAGSVLRLRCWGWPGSCWSCWGWSGCGCPAIWGW